MAYLTYEEYQARGGTATETAFNTLLMTVECKLDFITNNRIPYLESIPEEVKMLCVKLIDVCNSTDIDRDTSLSSYSNGIESFSYSKGNTDSNASTTIDGKLNAIIREWLWKYSEILYRGRKQWKQK